jgi:hypothetical protein
MQGVGGGREGVRGGRNIVYLGKHTQNFIFNIINVSKSTMTKFNGFREKFEACINSRSPTLLPPHAENCTA